jgi:transcriptional regulator with XRE-family HTH domain
MSEPKKRPRSYVFHGDVALMARLRKGWTQRDVMERCIELELAKVNDSNLAKYERGDLTPSPPVLAAIAQALDLSIDELVSPRVRTESAA